VANADARPLSWHQNLYRWLSAPLLITVVGALLVNYFIPKITSHAQNHQRALEVKTSLVREMSESLAAAISDGRLIATDVVTKAGGNPNVVFQSGLRDWQVSSARIRSEIEAYFPKTSLGDDWADLTRALTDTYFLSASGLSRDFRCGGITEVMRYLGVRPPMCSLAVATGAIHWDVLLAGERGPTFRTSYAALADRMAAAGDVLVRRLLRASPAGG